MNVFKRTAASLPGQAAIEVGESRQGFKGIGLMTAGHFIDDIYPGFLPPLLPIFIDRFGLSLALAGALGTVLSLSTSVSQLGFGLIFLGLIMNFMGLAVVGLILFGGTALFTLVTLPVELDASRRALKLLESSGLLASAQDREGVRTVLTAAAFTYVAAVATSLLTLLYYAMLIFGGRRD